MIAGQGSWGCPHCQTSPSKGDHRIIEWPGLKRTTMIIKFQLPCYVQGHQPPDQAAQSHIQPGLECLQGWGIHSLLGQPIQCVTTLWVKNFLLISHLNLPCLSLKPFTSFFSPVSCCFPEPLGQVTASCSIWSPNASHSGWFTSYTSLYSQHRQQSGRTRN